MSVTPTNRVYLFFTSKIYIELFAEAILVIGCFLCCKWDETSLCLALCWTGGFRVRVCIGDEYLKAKKILAGKKILRIKPWGAPEAHHSFFRIIFVLPAKICFRFYVFLANTNPHMVAKTDSKYLLGLLGWNFSPVR